MSLNKFGLQVVRPLLQERTRKKIQVLSGSGREELLKVRQLLDGWITSWEKCCFFWKLFIVKSIIWVTVLAPDQKIHLCMNQSYAFPFRLNWPTIVQPFLRPEAIVQTKNMVWCCWNMNAWNQYFPDIYLFLFPLRCTHKSKLRIKIWLLFHVGKKCDALRLIT